MRQIPTSGEFCGECYTYWDGCDHVCMVYNDRLIWSVHHRSPIRLQVCRKDRPQMLTEEERGDIFHAGMKAGYDNALELASEGKEVTP